MTLFTSSAFNVIRSAGTFADKYIGCEFGRNVTRKKRTTTRQVDAKHKRNTGFEVFLRRSRRRPLEKRFFGGFVRQEGRVGRIGSAVGRLGFALQRGRRGNSTQGREQAARSNVADTRRALRRRRVSYIYILDIVIRNNNIRRYWKPWNCINELHSGGSAVDYVRTTN